MIRAELKMKAKEQIKGNIGKFFGIYLVYMLIVSVATAIIVAPFLPGMIRYAIAEDVVRLVRVTIIFSSVISLFAILIAPPFVVGWSRMFLRLTDGKSPKVADLFAAFKYYWKTFCLYILVMFFTLLWSLLLIVPGIIKAISYSQAFFILAENPNMTAIEALNESKKITNGRKKDLFVLGLSFFWWILLVGITAGIAAIWVFPYICATFANFYNAIKNKPAPVVEEIAE